MLHQKNNDQLSSYVNLVPQVETWIKTAGKMALKDFKAVKSVHAKGDDTLLTETDKVLEGYLTAVIRQTYPDHGFIAEEGSVKDGRSPFTWVIDPLDGTTVFVRGLPGWGISVALFHKDQPIFGMHYMPLLDHLSYATTAGAWSNGELLVNSVAADWRHNGFLAVTASAHHTFELGVARIRALGSVSASLVYAAMGTATAVFIPKAYLWDLAAGGLMVEQAGGVLHYLSGTPVILADLVDGRLNPEPIVAGHPQIVDELLTKIRPV